MKYPFPPIYVDLRCLQDPLYQYRGVGSHVSSLLRSRSNTVASGCAVVGLTDKALPDLPNEYRQLCEEVSPCLHRPIKPDGAIFVDSSPMTHDPIPILHFLGHPHALNASIVYDFIPLDRPGYLPDNPSRIEYVSRLVRLKKADIFLPISDFSARRLSEILGISSNAICVTGACVRQSLYQSSPPRKHATPNLNSFNRNGQEPYFLTVGGGDRRKNTEAVVSAVERLVVDSNAVVSLKIVGHYGDAYKTDLLDIARQRGNGDFLEFLSDLSDASLRDLYAGAVATVAPSYIEGFSIPVVESAVCGSPVIVSECVSHCELIDRPEALFPADEPDVLANRLEAVLNQPTLREQLAKAQSHLPAKFHEEAVSRRFWNFVVQNFDQRFHGLGAPAVKRCRKPKVAFLSPFPPEESGVATYTQKTLESADRYFDVDLYTDAPRPLELCRGVRDAGPISRRPFIRGDHNAVLSVIGNSHFHIPIFKLFEHNGGPCILHDSRLNHIYHYRLGPDRFVELATRLLERPVEIHEIPKLLDEQQAATFFLEPILERADPLIVHTQEFRRLLKERHGADAKVAQFTPHISFSAQQLRDPARSATRDRLGLAGDVFVLATFGHVDVLRKGFAVCVAALDLLRSWKVPAELYCIGSAAPARKEVLRIARNFRVEKYIHLSWDFVDAERYRDFLIASDAAIQVRNFGLGQPSAALTDCISAGLPTVTTDEMAACCDAPSYVMTVPNHVSPLFIAEHLASLFLSGRDSVQIEQERQQYCDVHSFERYVRTLAEILGFDPS